MDRMDASDAVSTAAGARQDSYLEARSDEYPATDAEAAEMATNAATDEDGDDDIEQLQAQIEETRSQMGETIDAIQERLSLQNISEQVKEQVSEQISSALETAKDSVYSATIGNLGKVGKFMQEFGKEVSKTEVVKTARSNPFPLVLIGLGVGLLAYELSGKNKRRNYRYQKHEDKNRDYADRNRQYGSSAMSSLKSAGSTLSGTASNAYSSVSETTGNALESVKDAANSAYGNVTDAANRAYSSVSDYASTAYDRAGEYGTQAREQYDYYIEENPLAIGAVALAVGAAVGMAIPSTRYENQVMGEYSQQLLDRAQTAAGDLVDRVKEVATEAQNTIGDEVRTAVDNTKKTITNEAKTQGLA